MTAEELKDWASSSLKNSDKARSLNEDQLRAVHKLRTFLATEPKVIFKEQEYDIYDFADMVTMESDLKAKILMMEKYLLQNSFLLCGPPGSGKTYTSEVAVQGYKLTYVAPTFQAAAVLLENSNAVQVSTLASVLGTAKLDKVTNAQGADDFYLRSKESIEAQYARSGTLPEIFSSNIMLIDEVSMVGGDGKLPRARIITEEKQRVEVSISNDTFIAILLRLIHRIEWFGTDLPAKFIFLGDYAQTPPVGTEGDLDAYLIAAMMQNENRFSSLSKIMRTDAPDIKELLTAYLAEIDRLNLLIKSGVGSDHPSANVTLLMPALPSRQNSEHIHYYNTHPHFVNQFIELYQNREPEFKFNPNYVSIITYNNEVHPKIVSMVNNIRGALFGDFTTKYHPGETLITKGTLVISDKTTGRKIILQKDTRVFVESVEYATSYFVIRGVSFKIELPRLTIRFVLNGKSYIETVFAASEYHVNQITNIRNGRRYNAGVMNLTDEEKLHFGIRTSTLSYGHWVELQNAIPDFGYGYVVNNFKVQGSSLQYAMVDESNILSARVFPKKRLQYLYTGLSRGRKGLFIYNSGNLINTPELISIQKELEPVEEAPISVDEEIPF